MIDHLNGEHHTPENLDFKARKMKFNLSSKTPRYWLHDDPFATHFFNAMSSTFPEGEKFFVRSVQHYRGEIKNEVLQYQINEFIGQEAYHANEHDEHIELLTEQGYPFIRKNSEISGKLMNWMNEKFPRFSLAATMGAEHLTAILAHKALENPDDPKNATSGHPDMAPIWYWHAVEETEHKAVAFDVYQEVDGAYGFRIFALLFLTVFFLAAVFILHSYLLAKDGLLFKLSTWTHGIKFLWGKDGYIRTIGPDYMRYFNRDFHPWEHDNRELMAAYKPEYQVG